MLSERRAGERGFTLIELMIVVAIVGILAVLATVGVRKYMSNAKTAEARNSLGQVAKDAAAAFEKESMAGTVLAQATSSARSRALCGSESSSVPATSSVKGRKYQSTVGDWNKGAATNAGFACLKFSMDQPQYFAYGYSATGTTGASGDTFTALANGDLNGDGLLSTFSITGAINASYALNIAPNLVETLADE